MTETSNLITKKIGELFDYTIPGEWGTEGDPENDIPVLRSTNFTNEGRIDYSNLAFRRIDSRRLALRLVNKETILIEKSGGSPSQPVGRIVYCDENFNGSASNFIEIAKINNLFCPKYIFFLLHFLYQSGLVLKYQQQTTGIINFKLEQYKNEEVLLPCDKQEQTQIATILSTIDRVIEQTEALISKQQRIKTGLMQDLLTKGIDENGNIRSEATHEFKDSAIGRIPVEWEIKKFFDCVSILKGQKDPKQEPYREWILVAPDHIESKMGILHTKKTASEQGAISGKYEFQAGDIIYSKIRPYLRKAIIAEFNGLCSADMYPLKPNDGFTSDFLLAIILGETFSKYAETVSERSGFPKINRTELSEFQFAVPQQDEQERISVFSQKLSQALTIENNRLQKLCSLKTGLMQDLLTGKVRVTDLLNQKTATN